MCFACARSGMIIQFLIIQNKLKKSTFGLLFFVIYVVNVSEEITFVAYVLKTGIHDFRQQEVDSYCITIYSKVQIIVIAYHEPY